MKIIPSSNVHENKYSLGSWRFIILRILNTLITPLPFFHFYFCHSFYFTLCLPFLISIFLTLIHPLSYHLLITVCLSSLLTFCLLPHSSLLLSSPTHLFCYVLSPKSLSLPPKTNNRHHAEEGASQEKTDGS